jgi:hypothetical protein
MHSPPAATTPAHSLPCLGSETGAPSKALPHALQSVKCRLLREYVCGRCSRLTCIKGGGGRDTLQYGWRGMPLWLERLLERRKGWRTATERVCDRRSRRTGVHHLRVRIELSCALHGCDVDGRNVRVGWAGRAHMRYVDCSLADLNCRRGRGSACISASKSAYASASSCSSPHS